MTERQLTAWEQYGLIVDLANEMTEQQHFLGKTALQKLVYFLQELYKVDCGYEFTMYTYGPFSSSLLGDLDVAKTLGGVEVSYNASTGGYHIVPGQQSGVLLEKASDFLSKNSEAIKAVVEEFGALNAKELELRATLVFLQRNATNNAFLSGEELVESVHELKPQFDIEIIRNAMNELVKRGYLERSREEILAKA